MNKVLKAEGDDMTMKTKRMVAKFTGLALAAMALLGAFGG